MSTNFSFEAAMLYENFERSQVGTMAGIARASQYYAQTNDSGPLEKLTQDESIFKFTPQGYMDLKQEEKLEVYKKAALTLAQGQIQKYDSDQDGKMNLNEFKLMGIFTQLKTSLMAGENIFDTLRFCLSKEFNDSQAETFNALNLNNKGDSADNLDVKETASALIAMDYGYAYNDKNEKMLDAKGNHEMGLDGKIVLNRDNSEQALSVLPDVYEQFFP